MTVPVPQYVYRAALVRVIDGDTLAARLDLGCHVAITRPIRLLGIDTPEVVGATGSQGRAAAAFALMWLCQAGADEWPLVVATRLDRDDRYGRLLGTIYRVSDQACLNDDLIAAGHAVAYDGGHRG
jgi:micrococcal nuclease